MYDEFFPEEITTPITLYIFARDTTQNLVTSHRAVLQGVYWESDGGAVMRETGNQFPGNVKLNIPMPKEVTGRTFVEPQEWYRLPVDELENYWTLDRLQQANTLILRGINDHVFDWATPQAHSAAISAFVNPLTGAIDVKRPQIVDPYPHGDFPYVDVTAR